MLRLVSQILINMDSSLADLLFLIKIIGTSKGVGAAFYGIDHNVHSSALFTDRAKILIHLSAADHIGSLYQDYLLPLPWLRSSFPIQQAPYFPALWDSSTVQSPLVSMVAFSQSSFE